MKKVCKRNEISKTNDVVIPNDCPRATNGTI